MYFLVCPSLKNVRWVVHDSESLFGTGRERNVLETKWSTTTRRRATLLDSGHNGTEETCERIDETE